MRQDNTTREERWSQAEIDEMLEVFRSEARRISQVDEHPPRAWIFANRHPHPDGAPGGEPYGLVEVQLEQLESDLDRDIFVAMLRRFADELGADVVAFVTETWLVAVPPGESEALAEAKRLHEQRRLSEHPDRREALMFLCSRRNAENSAWSAFINPTEEGYTRSVDEWEELPVVEGALFVWKDDT